MNCFSFNFSRSYPSALLLDVNSFNFAFIKIILIVKKQKPVLNQSL